MVRFEAIEVAVEVTTDCMPPMSLVIRDCTSPVRVRVKKRDRLALQVGEDVGAQPVHDLLADGGGDPGLHDAERGGHGGDGDHADDQPDQQRQVAAAGSASSMTARSRNGEAIATTDDTTMIAVTTASGQRCGVNRRADAAQRDLAGLRLLRGGDGVRPAGGGRS